MKRHILTGLLLAVLLCATTLLLAGDVITTGRDAPFYHSANDQWTQIDSALMSRSVKTAYLDVGLPDDVNVVDANFTSVSDANEQTLDLGEVVPPFARVLDVSIVCTEDVNSTAADGATSFSTDAGNAAGDAQWIGSAVDVNDVNDCAGSAAGGACFVAISNSAQKVYVNSTPGENWDTLDAGRWRVIVTYLDLQAMKEDD